VSEFPDQRLSDFVSAIKSHYRESSRSFPWRETRDPYRILVSEIMLQQTQTDRVVPKYLEWLDAYPDAVSLAAAPFGEVLGHWVGLGYNRRARFLQEACKAVVASGGEFPSEPDALDALPGIGPYTARAISTFAFGLPQVFIETNIRSVFLFFFFPDTQGVDDKELLPLIEATLDRDDPRSWYYALMDYGADLKRKVVNPNRRSSAYGRQSKFQGSVRQARGAIVRYLDAHGCGTLESVAAEESLPYERVELAAAALIKEGLIVADRTGYRIS
jgi:A/G-specific adenine glycosylase